VLTRDLKGHMNFSGWVMSDWGATHKTSALMAGLDQEMPETTFMGSDVVAAEVANGTVTQAKIDDSVTRIMTALLAVGAMDRKPGSTGNATSNVTSAEHNALARQLASAGICLLQNNPAAAASAPPLPLAKSVKHFALFGNDALNPIVHGEGSGAVTPGHVTSPMQALRAQLGFPTAWEDKHVPQSTVSDCHGGACISLTPHGSSGSAIGAALKTADVALIFGSTICGEGEDRIDLSLNVPKRWNGILKRNDLQGQDEFIASVGTAAKAAGVPSVGAIVTPGPLLTPWSEQLDALLVSFMPGQEYGKRTTSV
jgi:beta-glucosidase